MVSPWPVAPLPESPLPSTPRVLRPRRAAPADAVRPTRAEVNLGNVRRNLHTLRRAADGSAIFGVLKADAYGHGAPAIGRTLERAGVDGFAVALLEEAIELRDAGIQKPILVMGGYYGQAWGEVLAARLLPVVYDAGQIEGLARAIRFADRDPVKVHLKLDTGMARLGVRPGELAHILDVFRRFPEVELDGLMTHLACADADDPSATRAQLELFDHMCADVRAAGFHPTVRHAANSAAVLSHACSLEIVRPGVALFGVPPTSRSGASEGLAPVMRIRSEIVALRELEAGESAGYGWTFKATRRTRLATVPIGYADGLPRSLSNRGHLLVRGQRAKIAGTVSMDMVMIDVTDVPGVSMRDEVVALGAQQGPLGKDEITAGEIAEHAGTIAWEVLTNISRRVPRFYREPLPRPREVSQAARALRGARRSRMVRHASSASSRARPPRPRRVLQHLLPCGQRRLQQPGRRQHERHVAVVDVHRVAEGGVRFHRGPVQADVARRLRRPVQRDLLHR